MTPLVQWQGRGLGTFDPLEDQLYNGVFDRLVGRDRICARER